MAYWLGVHVEMVWSLAATVASRPCRRSDDADPVGTADRRPGHCDHEAEGVVDHVVVGRNGGRRRGVNQTGGVAALAATGTGTAPPLGGQLASRLGAGQLVPARWRRAGGARPADGERTVSVPAVGQYCRSARR